MRTRDAILGLGAFLALAAVPLAPALAQPCCGPVTPDGQKLAAMLDRSGVDHLWLARQHILWETGTQDPARPGGTRHTTHCSAYAAAMAERAGVYLLRPPEHGQSLLANAQMEWLEGPGASATGGWRRLDEAADAQAAANNGELVVAVYENPDPRRPGHIAVLRPSEKTRAELDRDGPQEAQAGAENALTTTVADGFRHHRAAWRPAGGSAVRFFAHAVSWPASG